MDKTAARRKMPDPVKVIRQVERQINRRLGLAEGRVSADPLKTLAMLGMGVWPEIYYVDSPELEKYMDEKTGKPKKPGIVPIDLQMEAAKAAALYVRRKLDGKDADVEQGVPQLTQQELAVAALMLDRDKRREVDNIIRAITAPRALPAPAILESVVTTQPEVILEGDPTD